jgi:hypothetical protein
VENSNLLKLFGNMELSGLATSVTKIEEIGPKVAKPRTKRNKSKRHKECKNKLKSIVVTSSTTKDIPNLAALKQNMKGPSCSMVFSDNKNSNFATAKISRESPSLALPEIKVDSSSCAKLRKIIKVSSKLS